MVLGWEPLGKTLEYVYICSRREGWINIKVLLGWKLRKRIEIVFNWKDSRSISVI